jgi:CheY-like chemotaxis protein
LRIMVADDLPDILQSTADHLSQWRIIPTTASNGAEALALATEQPFDLILMDIAMPVMDGLEATQKIRHMEAAHPHRARTPIVAYTSGVLLWDTALQERVGFDEVLRKPANAKQLQACILRCTGSKAAPAALKGARDTAKAHST